MCGGRGNFVNYRQKGAWEAKFCNSLVIFSSQASTRIDWYRNIWLSLRKFPKNGNRINLVIKSWFINNLNLKICKFKKQSLTLLWLAPEKVKTSWNFAFFDFSTVDPLFNSKKISKTSSESSNLSKYKIFPTETKNKVLADLRREIIKYFQLLLTEDKIFGDHLIKKIDQFPLSDYNQALLRILRKHVSFFLFCFEIKQLVGCNDRRQDKKFNFLEKEN